MAGISNETIVKFFENETDDDLTSNFVGVFPSNYVTKFISFHEMIIEKNRYPFIIRNTDCSDKNSTHWWSFLTCTKEKKFFYLIVLVLKGLKSSLLTKTEIFLLKFYLELKNFKKRIKGSP